MSPHKDLAASFETDSVTTETDPVTEEDPDTETDSVIEEDLVTETDSVTKEDSSPCNESKMLATKWWPADQFRRKGVS
jgi:hypothetical protein